MGSHWIASIAALCVSAGCKSGEHGPAPKTSSANATKTAPSDAAASAPDAAVATPPPATNSPQIHRLSADASGTAFFAPDAQSFWMQNHAGDAMVHLALDGKELERVPLAGSLEDAALWIRTSFVRHPMSPDGHRLLESRSEPTPKDHTEFIVDLSTRREEPIPVKRYTHVDWLPDGSLLVNDLAGTSPGRLDLATGKRTPLCKGHAGVSEIAATADGKALIVTDDKETFLADLGCKKLRTLTTQPRMMVLDSPHGTAWLAIELAEPSKLSVLSPSSRSVGSMKPSRVAWLDDDRFVFIAPNPRSVGGTAMWASVSSSAPPAPVHPEQEGCADLHVTGAPAGGVVVVATGCGEGNPSPLYVVQ